MSTRKGYRLPNQSSYRDTVNFLIHHQFPVVMEDQISITPVLPMLGSYKQLKEGIMDFDKALLSQTEQEFTISGAGSLLDLDKYGHTLKRPSPQLTGTGCEGSTLCQQPECYSFQEGVIESNNVMETFCWELAMPCLKDFKYSDRKFDQKIAAYIDMFMRQPGVVVEGYQRTRLLRDSIKIVATEEVFSHDGPTFASAEAIPFYIDHDFPTALPNLNAIPGTVGAANLEAFVEKILPVMFQDLYGANTGFKVYGLKRDFYTAKKQSMRAVDNNTDMLLQALLQKTFGSMYTFDSMVNDSVFCEDKNFPTFRESDVIPGQLVPVEAERLVNTTIAGVRMDYNPQHNMQKYRGLMIVPDSYMFSLVAPELDDYSYLGLGEGLDFRNAPGVYNVALSSGMFRNSRIGSDGIVSVGQKSVGDNVVYAAKGIERLSTPRPEAIRTELLQTYSNSTGCGSPEGQLPRVGAKTSPQFRPDGFLLRSTITFATQVKGISKPLLYIFEKDDVKGNESDRSCNPIVLTVDTQPKVNVVDCCPHADGSITIYLDGPASTLYSEGDIVNYRNGRQGLSYLAVVSGIFGANDDAIQLTPVDSAGQVLTDVALPCCKGGQNDDYGVLSTIIVNTGSTLTSSEVFGAEYDEANSAWVLELFKPLVASTAGAAGTLELASGDVINVQTSADAEGVFISVEIAAGETCDLSALTCNDLFKAILTLS